MTRLEANFIAMVAVQAVHSIEEYLGRLWVVFPPAAFVTSLVSDDRQRGFILINVALLLFGLVFLLARAPALAGEKSAYRSLDNHRSHQRYRTPALDASKASLHTGSCHSAD